MSRPLAVLTRTGLTARIATLRDAIDVLMDQSDTDGAGAYECLGAMKVTLIDLEQRVREMDRRTSQTLSSTPWSAELDRLLDGGRCD